MGPHIKGFIPPFTPTGRSSHPRFDPRPGADPPIWPGIVASHWGILVRWVADGDYVAKLLPHPLEPTERTEEVSFFVNETLALPDGVDVATVAPEDSRFNEAII